MTYKGMLWGTYSGNIGKVVDTVVPIGYRMVQDDSMICDIV
jgi:hypothetical protein